MNLREEEILRVAANKVRVLSAKQVARTWWSDTRWGLCRANESLWDLAARRLLVMQSVLARPISRLTKPLLLWELADAAPPFRELSRVLHERAKATPLMTTVVFATQKTIALFGNGDCPSVKITQMTHDLHVSEVFLRLRANGLPTKQWQSEDQLPNTWPIKVRPDALLLDEHGVPARAIEYGGDYSAARLLELHHGFDSIGLGYELW